MSRSKVRGGQKRELVKSESWSKVSIIALNFDRDIYTQVILFTEG